jgi:ketosteroid isomerase-like protein
MNELTKDDLREIEQIYSNWIEYEVVGDNHSLMALCADDIELWPPDAQPLLGYAAVSAQMARGMTKIHSIEITDRRIRGSNEIAYLTASYRTTFSSAEDSTCRQALGSHLWMMRKRTGTWVVVLVSWSVWGSADSSATSQPLYSPAPGSHPEGNFAYVAAKNFPVHPYMADQTSLIGFLPVCRSPAQNTKIAHFFSAFCDLATIHGATRSLPS